MSNITLTFTQCKQIINNGYTLSEVVEKLNDQPEFMSDNTGMQIDSISELQSIIQCGCASNAHSSVFYYEAAQCMAKHGDDVLVYIKNHYGELPSIPEQTGWNQIASFYLVIAIESWCYQFNDILEGVNWD